MAWSARRLLEAKAQTEEAAFPVRQLYFMPETWKLRYAILDLGGWFHADEVLVSVDRFGLPTEDGWPLAMAREELDSAPKVEDTGSDTTSLPPLIVGPFGNTFSPLMFAAVQADMTIPDETAADDQAHSPDGSGRVLYMEKVTEWLGIDAFGDAGSLGRIEDLELDDTLTFTHALLDDGSRIDLSRYRRTADQGHALFDQ
ncbi:hypothetical protein [Palleronia sp. LCG004]|uniref:hypothetical protein n=1 Tax=Palleronia sp. LCG004 TaxID=3079304 RepID=UPI002943846C|nr:hypothetical protein [Palleronia sp. LCG004]WOI56012.1 hypothetical protein RVY76_13370 [Palleronia sp. LCG004]